MSERSLDAGMVRRADGDRAGGGPVFEAIHPRVSAFCRSLLGAADGQDATQEAMKKVFEQAHRYDRERPALAWAIAIAGWECRTFRRRQQRLRETSADPQPEGHADGEREVLARAEVRMALAALDQLEERDREALMLDFEEDHPPLSPAQRKRKERALDRVRRIMRRLYGTS